MFVRTSLMILGTVLLVGCGTSGPQLGTVDGTVTLNGEPLKEAVVSFRPVAGGRTAEGITNDKGEFVIEFAAGSQGALLGDHEVRVTTFRERVIADNGRVEDPGVLEKVPSKYNDESELIRTVEPGANHFELELSGT